MKVAVSIPDPIFEAMECLARQRHVPRSSLHVPCKYLETHGSEAVTAKLDEIHAAEDSAVAGPLPQAQNAAIEREAW